MIHLLVKKVGETPLECLERFRAGDSALSGIPMTYAGRLDPMAEGLLLALSGDDCKKKDSYLGLNKVYETTVLFGISTDTYDLLGIPEAHSAPLSIQDVQKILPALVGRQSQVYPPYSSKPHNGTPLFQLARDGELPEPEEMPSREVEVFSVEFLSGEQISRQSLLSEVVQKVSLVRGDFRQQVILAEWKALLEKDSKQDAFLLVSLRIACSSGTYVRSLADGMGKSLNAGALAFSIKRISIGPYLLDEAVK